MGQTRRHNTIIHWYSCHKWSRNCLPFLCISFPIVDFLFICTM